MPLGLSIRRQKSLRKIRKQYSVGSNLIPVIPLPFKKKNKKILMNKSNVKMLKKKEIALQSQAHKYVLFEMM